MKKLFLLSFFMLVFLTIIFYPLDAFEQWTKIPLTLSGQELNCIGLSSSGAFFLATEHELLRSVDQTKTWQSIFVLNNDQKAINDIIFDKDDNVYICTQNGILASKDNGDNWQTLFVNCNKYDKNVIGFSVDNQQEYVYILKKYQLYKGKIGADLWQKVDTITSLGSSEDILLEEDAQIDDNSADHYTDISIDGYGKIYVSSTKGVFLSGDSAVTWTFLAGKGRYYEKVKRPDSHRGCCGHGGGHAGRSRKNQEHSLESG